MGHATGAKSVVKSAVSSALRVYLHAFSLYLCGWSHEVHRILDGTRGKTGSRITGWQRQSWPITFAPFILLKAELFLP